MKGLIIYKFTVNGIERSLKLKRVPDSVDKSKLVCDSCCSYGSVCNNIAHPYCPENTTLDFADFCNKLDIKEGNNNYTYYPAEDSIEQCFFDLDIYKSLIKSDPLIRTSSVIKVLCSNTCEDYREDFSKCDSRNTLCILKNLFKKENL